MASREEKASPLCQGGEEDIPCVKRIADEASGVESILCAVVLVLCRSVSVLRWKLTSSTTAKMTGRVFVIVRTQAGKGFKLVLGPTELVSFQISMP